MDYLYEYFPTVIQQGVNQLNDQKSRQKASLDVTFFFAFPYPNPGAK